MESKSLKFYFSVFSMAAGFVLVLMNFSKVIDFINLALGILAPFTIGFVLAYIVNMPYKLFYNKAFAVLENKGKFLKKLHNPLSLVCSYIVVLSIIAFLLCIVVPEVSSSVNTLISNFDSYISQTHILLENTLKSLGLANSENSNITELLNNLSKNLTGSEISELLKKYSSAVFPQVFDITKNVTTAVYNIFLSIIVSIYMLAYKKQLLTQCKKFVCTVLPNKAIASVMEVARLSNEMVGKFIYGKIIDSCIVAVISFICMSILGFDYPSLISVVIGFFNIIPFFGPIIGAIPCVFLLLIINPVEAFWFSIYLLILQQVDGNIIGPKILGDSIGINGFWIMFSVLVGTGLFGIAGMFLGVPIFAVIYYVSERFVERKLKKKACVISDHKITIGSTEIITSSFTEASEEKNDKDSKANNKAKDE